MTWVIHEATVLPPLWAPLHAKIPPQALKFQCTEPESFDNLPEISEI